MHPGRVQAAFQGRLSRQTLQQHSDINCTVRIWKTLMCSKYLFMLWSPSGVSSKFPRNRIENTNEDWGSLLASLRELTEWVSDNNNNNILIVITIIKRVSRWWEEGWARTRASSSQSKLWGSEPQVLTTGGDQGRRAGCDGSLWGRREHNTCSAGAHHYDHRHHHHFHHHLHRQEQECLTCGRSMDWEKKNVSRWIFFEIGRWWCVDWESRSSKSGG